MRMKRRSFLGAAAAAASLPAGLSTPALAQGESKQVLKFVPQANLTSLDPIWTTAAVTAEHACYVFDTLYAVDGNFRAHPQMAKGHTVSNDGKTMKSSCATGCSSTTAPRSAPSTAWPASSAGRRATRSA